MKRYGKYSEKYEIIINGKGLPVQKKKKKKNSKASPNNM